MVQTIQFFKVVCLLFLLLMICSSAAQEITWYSIDNGGGISSDGDVVLSGVVGQADVIRMEGKDVTISGGYLPLPADLIFEHPFD